MLFEEPKTFSVDLEEIRKQLLRATYVSIDLETTGLDFYEDRITIVSIAAEIDGAVVGWVIDCREHPIEKIREVLGPVFLDDTKTFIFHNASFDVRFLNKYSIYFGGRIADTMIMAWLYDEDRVRHGGYGLKHCVLKHLNYKMASYEEARSLFGSFEDYAADDAKQTLLLFFFFKKSLEEQGLMEWFWKIEMPVCALLIEAEAQGVYLDKEQLRRLKKEAFEKLEEIEKKIYELVGYKFDVGSPKQWSRILFDEKKIGMRPDGTNEFSARGKNGDWSTSNAVLEAMQRAGHELPNVLLDFREINTRLNVFIKPLLERALISPIIHPRFIQVGTVSGRFASRDPNYQNLPRKGGIRRAFIARPGYKIVRADYSQAELRLMAHMSGDPIMIEIYRSGGDIHQTTADACGVSRQAAKAINFGLIYRMSAARLQAQLALQGIEISIVEAVEYVKRYFRNYKRVREYHKKVEDTVIQRLNQSGTYGYVRTLGGRYRRLDKNFLTQKDTEYTAITQAINTTIQGGVSDLIKVAMVDIQNDFRKRGWLDPAKGIWDAYLSGQVHDELFVECKEAIAEEVKEVVQYHLENAGRKFNIKVPMTADAKVVDHLDKD